MKNIAIALLFSLFSISAFANRDCQYTGTDCTIPVLIYHRVTDESPPSDTVISPAMLRAHVQEIHRMGYNTITVSELTKYMVGRKFFPEKTVVLTFDDGWKDNLVAAEILKEMQMSATFYVLSGTFDHHMYLNKEELVRLSRYRGVEIGAHTHTHFVEWESDLSKLDYRIMIGEMILSKIMIERTIGKRVYTFSWPYGFTKPEALDVVADMGFDSAVHVNSETANSSRFSTLDIRRININGACTPKDIRSMIETRKLKECYNEKN